MSGVDVELLATSIGHALPGAAPFAAIPMFVDQVRWLDQDAGRQLVEQIVARAHPSTWGFDDDQLDAWRPPVADAAAAAIRALPTSESRTQALMGIPRRLTSIEQREALNALLDGTFAEGTNAHTKPMSRRHTIVAFVRTLQEVDREAWVRAQINGQVPVLSEVLARRDVGSLTDAALRDLWRRIPAPTRGDVPSQYQRLAHHLPVDLRRQALTTIRACRHPSTRLLHLVLFDDELTDAERREVVQTPWNEHTRQVPRSQVDHLQSVAHHLGKVAVEVRRGWLAVVLGFEEHYVRQRGLLHLLRFLSGDDYRSAVTALLGSVEHVGKFYDQARWDLVPDSALDGFVLRLRDDLYGWPRDALVAHVLETRSPATADRVGALLLDGLDERGPDTRLEIVRALTPWLAARTAGAAPRALAALPVPTSDRAPDPLYRIARVLKNETWADD